jgi:hypothetical protein
MKSLIKRTRFAIYILLATGFIVSCSGDSEVGKGILTFLDAPVTEMSVGDLVILLVDI